MQTSIESISSHLSRNAIYRCKNGFELINRYILRDGSALPLHGQYDSIRNVLARLRAGWRRADIQLGISPMEYCFPCLRIPFHNIDDIVRIFSLPRYSFIKSHPYHSCSRLKSDVLQHLSVHFTFCRLPQQLFHPPMSLASSHSSDASTLHSTSQTK